MKKLFITIIMMLSFQSVAIERNLVLVTIDGLRWQEIFQGRQLDLIDNKTFTPHKNTLLTRLSTQSENQAKKILMPFIWNTIAQQGVLIGDRKNASNMSVSNDWYFSYPGYSEIFTGVTNPTLNSNNKVPNPEVSFLEWLANDKKYAHVAAFGSWDVFPYILNTERSKLYVNAGFDKVTGDHLSPEINLLNELQDQVPSPWHNVRLDAFTHRYALDYLKTHKPRVMSISYGETDDFAHDGRYDHYLAAAHRTDQFIQELWLTLQSMDQYKNNTNIIIVTDHGRGKTTEDWQHHASATAVKSYMKHLDNFKDGIIGANHIWMAALGPDIKKLGVYKNDHEIYQSQIAATALTLLNEKPTAFNEQAGKAIKEIIK
ncbi:alkaline phosphatase family protein [Thalassotalea piscium]